MSEPYSFMFPLPRTAPPEPQNEVPTQVTPEPVVQKKEEAEIHKPLIKVLGLGGGGSNAVNRMIDLQLTGVEFIAANTDYQALSHCLAPVRIQLGPRLTRGRGAGGDPEVGRHAAEESRDEIAAALQGADMVFLAAGMGGGTGTGAIPVAAQVAREVGAVSIAVVTTPFSFEMGRRQKNATEGLKKLRTHTDTLVSISNDRLFNLDSPRLTLDMAFRMADDVLRQAVQGITDLINNTGYINVDFSNIQNLMRLGGGALMAIGQADGDDKGIKAIQAALNHPLLEINSLEHAAGLLVNLTSSENLSFVEFQTALTYLREQVRPDADIVVGVVVDERMQDRLEAILFITGLGATALEATLPGFETRSAASMPRFDSAMSMGGKSQRMSQPDLDLTQPVSRMTRLTGASGRSSTPNAVQPTSLVGDEPRPANPPAPGSVMRPSIGGLDTPSFLRK